MGELLELRKKSEEFDVYPKGRVIVKATKRTYHSKTMGIRTYINYYWYIDVDGKQIYVGKQGARGGGITNARGSDDVHIMLDMLIEKRDTECKISELEREIKEISEKLNLNKKTKETAITDDYAKMLGMFYAENAEFALKTRKARRRKTNIARNGTDSELMSEFYNAKQAAFYLNGGKIIENGAKESMRSRAELIVGDILQRLNIEYVYEYYVKEAAVSCDFLMYICGRRYYLEVLGMMDRDDYRSRWAEKEAAYSRAGIEKGINLIVFDLSERDYIDAAWLTDVIAGVAAGKVPGVTVYGIKETKNVFQYRKRADLIGAADA